MRLPARRCRSTGKKCAAGVCRVSSDEMENDSNVRRGRAGGQGERVELCESKVVVQG